MEEKCICKHKRKDHGLYIENRANSYGSKFVCQKDGCNMWAYCNLKEVEHE